MRRQLKVVRVGLPLLDCHALRRGEVVGRQRMLAGDQAHLDFARNLDTRQFERMGASTAQLTTET